MASSSLERRPPDDELLSELADLFGRAHLRGAIIGGVARNHWEIPRLTFDIDITVAADREAVEFVLRGLIKGGFQIQREQERDRPSGIDFAQLYNRDRKMMVEFQSAKTPYQEMVLDRAVPLDGAGPLSVATPEDLIVLKLIAFRDKDRDDLRMLARREGLDWEYISRWAETWQVTDRLVLLKSWEAEPGRA